MDDKITTQDVLARLGMPGEKSKLRFWVQAAGLEVPKDGAGAWRWTPELVEQVQLIKTLREVDNRSLETVRRVIGAQTATEAEQPASSEGAAPAQRTESAATAGPDLAPLVQAIEKLVASHPSRILDGAELAETISASLAPQLVQAIQAQTELAEKYARAAHQIGALEAELKHTRTQLEEKVRQIESVRPWWKFWS